MAKRQGWFEERLEVSKLAWLGTRIVPKGVTWWYTFGAATLILFVILAVTGVFLMLNYDPSPDHAYQSVQFIIHGTQFGLYIHSIHHWAAYAMVLLVVVHMLAVFFLAAYRYPRELTWVIGVFLLLLVGGMAFTGYLLPWDQRAYWATVIGTNIAGETPFIGTWIKEILLGGNQIGVATLTRFYALHVVILPVLMATLIGLHVTLVVRQGISTPPEATSLECD